ncbi:MULTISPECIES: hypothetical protein [Stutzerimonas stutzeri group]|jgi:hypothetical protein|nr:MULTISPECIES: hypothetical protein [Stutzerimonas stutzeri group]HIN66349.1 hypothetical protein [Candidatus Obscuribacterales bacterium]AZL50096.1 hypothetical protein CXB48_21625 [Stutzerimonas stutzeri]MBK3760539.1 hypothetical protein [Stutzerimonas frequens]MBK3872542.1 hypothetical protein [Stutzerimonas frequens]MBK3910469.1 hypothetical protein [Stutzerimonas frequens]
MPSIRFFVALFSLFAPAISNAQLTDEVRSELERPEASATNKYYIGFKVPKTGQEGIKDGDRLWLRQSDGTFNKFYAYKGFMEVDPLNNIVYSVGAKFHPGFPAAPVVTYKRERNRNFDMGIQEVTNICEHVGQKLAVEIVSGLPGRIYKYRCHLVLNDKKRSEPELDTYSYYSDHLDMVIFNDYFWEGEPSVILKFYDLEMKVHEVKL